MSKDTFLAKQFCEIVQDFADAVRSDDNRRQALKDLFDSHAAKAGPSSAAAAVLAKFASYPMNMRMVERFTTVVEKHLDPVQPNRVTRNKAAKQAVLLRQGGCCNNPTCRKPITVDNSEWDHRIPFEVAFEELGEDNMQVLCKECNTYKASKIKEWAMFDFTVTGRRGPSLLNDSIEPEINVQLSFLDDNKDDKPLML